MAAAFGTGQRFRAFDMYSSAGRIGIRSSGWLSAQTFEAGQAVHVTAGQRAGVLEDTAAAWTGDLRCDPGESALLAGHGCLFSRDPVTN